MLIFLIWLVFTVRKCLLWFLSTFMRRVDKLVVDTVIELAVVVDFVLSVLVTTPCSKLDKSFLFDHGSLAAVHFFKLAVVTNRAVEGR